MKILFINPNPYILNKRYLKMPTFFKNLYFSYPTVCPPLVFPILSSITPKKYNIDFIEDGYNKINFELKYDLVAITSNTVQSTRAYQIADKFRKKKIPVIIGGCHATACPKEVKLHADAVVIGEVEEIWSSILKDLEENKLKPFYKQKKPTNLNNLPKPDMTILNGPLWIKYNQFYITQASRGCKNNCKFCFIGNSINNKFRTRPIKDIIDEIKTVKQKIILFYDPSITSDQDYFIDLCDSLKKTNKKFIFEGNSNILANNDVLLKISKEAGCINWVIGFESVSQRTLNNMNKTNKVSEYYDLIKKIHDLNMNIHGLFMFGFDSDDINVFSDTLNFLKKAKIDSVEFSILTPLPGTPFYDKLKSDNRIIKDDWSKFGYDDVVFELLNFTEREFVDMMISFYNEYYSIFQIRDRIIANLKRGFRFDVSTFIADNLIKGYINKYKMLNYEF